MARLRFFWRDIGIVIRAVWLNMVLFVTMILVAAILLKAAGTIPDASFLDIVVRAWFLTFFESLPVNKQGWVAALLAFTLPTLMILILGEGVVRVMTSYQLRRENREDWDPMVIQTFKNHTVICGLGELGRAICFRILEQDPETQLALVDTQDDLLAELGLTEKQYPNVAHVHSDMTSKATLEDANVARASLVIITSGADGHNLETGVKVNELNPQAQIWIRLHRSKVAQLIRPTPNVHFFSPYEKAAEFLLGSINNL